MRASPPDAVSVTTTPLAVKLMNAVSISGNAIIWVSISSWNWASVITTSAMMIGVVVGKIPALGGAAVIVAKTGASCAAAVWLATGFGVLGGTVGVGGRVESLVGVP